MYIEREREKLYYVMLHWPRQPSAPCTSVPSQSDGSGACKLWTECMMIVLIIITIK